MEKILVYTLIVLTLNTGCNKEELSKQIIPIPKERSENALVKSNNRTLNQVKMPQDGDESTNGNHNVTSLIISNSPLLQFTPDTIHVPVGTQVQLYSNVDAVYGSVPNIHGEWRSWNVPSGQITRYGGLLSTYSAGMIRITYTCGVMGTNLPNYQVSTRILVH